VVPAVACVCWLAALAIFWPPAMRLADMWWTDDLKSMGALVPFVSFALILRVWRRLGWTTRGSWWGLALLAVWALLIYLREQTLLVITVDKWWLLQIPPLPLVAVVVGAGLVWLLAGRELLRAAWFPIVLLWAVIPVPQTFSRRVDLPLQHLSAMVARAFAHKLGAPLTSDRLRLMFTPDFGMFIAPGCNGIRGAITLGLAALIVSYVYRFRWYVFAPVVAGAVLLGYLFNLLRLCLLVIYYKIALPYPWLQGHAEMGDYIIGGCLFVLALAIFFTVVNRLRERPSDVRPEPAARDPRPEPLRPLLLRAGALLVLAAIFGGEYARLHAERPLTTRSIPRLPAQIGNYRLVNSYDDTLVDGMVVYTWGEYAGPQSGSPHVKLGIAPMLDSHDVEVCHMTRGEDPSWNGEMDASSPGGSMHFALFDYVDGEMQWLEASTVCVDGTCSESNKSNAHITVVYAKPHHGLPLTPDPVRPVPVLLRVESGDVTTPAAAEAARLSATMKDFLSQADLVKLTAPYSRR
jgi:exosortase J